MKKFTFNVAVIKPALIPGIMLTVLLMLQALDPFDISQHGLAWVSGSSKAKLSSDIVILDIDPASQKKYGTWPFDRRDLATLVNRLRSEGAGAIILDLPLTDPDRAKGDDDLARALAAKGVILVQQVTDEPMPSAYVPKKFQGVDQKNLEKFDQHSGVVSPLAKLAQSSSGVGTVNFAISDDLYNKFPLVMSVNGTLYASPIAEALRYTVHEPYYDFKSTQKGLRIGIGQFLNIPTDSLGRFYINYDHQFETIKLSQNKLKSVKNKMVVVGSSISGVNHQLSTPLGKTYSHVIQTHALQTILDGPPPLRSTFVTVLESIMAAAAFLALWYFWKKSWDPINLVKLVLILSITIGIPFVALSNINVLFDPVWPTVISLAPVIYILFHRYRHVMRCYLCQWLCRDKDSKDKL